MILTTHRIAVVQWTQVIEDLGVACLVSPESCLPGDEDDVPVRESKIGVDQSNQRRPGPRYERVRYCSSERWGYSSAKDNQAE